MQANSIRTANKNIFAHMICAFLFVSVYKHFFIVDPRHRFEPRYKKIRMSFPNRSDTNRPVQLQKQARSLRRRGIILCSENKGTDPAKLNCVDVFAYADCWFSHDAAHFSLLK